MKQTFCKLLIACVLASCWPLKSEAAVGLIINSRATRVIGGTISLSGLGISGASVVLNGIFGNSYLLLGASVIGAAGAIIGLVVLEDKSAELKFKELSLSQARLVGISEADLEIYHREIDELNIIKEVIESQTSHDSSEEEVKSLWNQFQSSLSPETMKVASQVAVYIFQHNITFKK